jgi:hypothetical protein
MADEVKRCVIGVLEGDSTTPCILRSLIRDINYLKKTFVSGSFVIYETTRERSKTDDWKKTLPSTWETKNGTSVSRKNLQWMIPCWMPDFCDVTLPLTYSQHKLDVRAHFILLSHSSCCIAFDIISPSCQPVSEFSLRSHPSPHCVSIPRHVACLY